MPHGTFNPDGTVTIIYNPFHGDKLYTDNGRKHLLPCERCGNVVSVSLPTCSVICEDCAPALDAAGVAPAPIIDREAHTAERARFMSDTCNRLVKAGKMEAAAVCLQYAVHLHPELQYTLEFAFLGSGPLGRFIADSPYDTFRIPVDSPEFRAKLDGILRDLYPDAVAAIDTFEASKGVH